MCEKCRDYLYDYFEQPVHKENPLYPFVNQKQVKKRLPELVPLISHLFQTILPHKFLDAKSQVENYCSFVIKPENPYQQYDILYTFLNREPKIFKEIKQMEGLLLDLHFLRLDKKDPQCRILHKWLAFLLGSLYYDMFILHRQHLGDAIWPINLEDGLPGRPDTGAKIKKKSDYDDRRAVTNDDDDLYR